MVVLKRMLLRGFLLVGAYLGVASMWLGSAPLGSYLFVACLGILGMLAALPEEAVQSRSGPKMHLLASLGATLVAGTGLIAAYLQVDYLLSVGTDWGPGALVASGASFDSYRAELVAVVSAFAPSFGIVCWVRLRRWRLGWQFLFSLAFSLGILALVLWVEGFVGLPQPGWLLREAWFDPSLGTFLFYLALLNPLLLPFVSCGVDRGFP